MNESIEYILKNPITIIAKKEIMDNIRNKWVIIISILFAALAILVSYAGSLFSEGWQDFGLTISGMSALVQYIISIIALILGYSAIIGEIEKGSMSSLLTLRTTRLEILLGKLLGLGIILSISILIGFGLAGIVIGLNISDANYLQYVVFIAVSILMGLTFLSLGFFISCIFNRRATAMGGAIFLWVFFAIIWSLISAGLLVATVDITNITSLPDWYFGFQLLNPLGPYGGFISLNIGPISAGAGDIPAIVYPAFYTSELMLFAEFLWFIIPLIAAIYLFNKKDI
jgi:Cu-processing system permease protein